uniref:HEAT repeat domain-containing protein n=1 Tax=Caldicellulosiruptor owensensis TaxID=55205 RepID=A0A7C5V1V5_9FIRM
MIDSINFVILCVICIVILLIIASGIVFLYKIVNSIRQEKIRQVFKNYSKIIYEVITGKRSILYAENFYLLSDVINTNYLWIDGEEKRNLYVALRNSNFFDFAIDKIQKGNRAQKLRFAKVFSVVGGEDELKMLLNISIKNPYLIDITAVSIFKNIDKIQDLGKFKPFLKTIFLNMDKYPYAIKRRIEFFAVYGGEKIKDILFYVIKENPSDKVLISCLNIFSEILTFEDLEHIDFLINHPSPEVRAAFCKVIEKIGYINSTEKLETLINNEEVNFVKLRALRALSNVSPKSSLKYLLSALEDDWFYMRDFAKTMLSEFGPVVLKDLLTFYYSTNDKFAKDKIREVFYSPVNFEYIIKSFLNYRTDYEKNLALQIIKILESSNPQCFYQRLKEEGYDYLITRKRGSE